MVRMFASAFVIAGLFASPAAAALSAQDVQKCNAMAATLTPKKAEIQTLSTKRDAQTARVEELGDQWEEAEKMRNFAEDGGAAADASKQSYETAKAELMQLERALQASARQFNVDISDYNRACAKK